MEVIFPAPQFLLWLIIGIFVIAVPAVFLKKGKLWIKIVSLVILVIVSGVLLFFFYRETKLAVTDDGLYSNNYGEFLIKWEDIDEVLVVDDLRNSDYKPVLRTNGFAMGDVGFGWFRLKNGKNARVVLQTRGACLVVLSGDMTYLFSPKDFEKFRQAVEQHITILPYRETDDDQN